MLLPFTRTLLVLSLLIAANPAFAKRLKSIPIDGDFVVTAFGSPKVVDGHNTYYLLALHKIVKFEGKTWVCGGIVKPVGFKREFIDQAKIVTSDGRKLKKGLSKLSKLSLTNEDKEIVSRGGEVEQPIWDYSVRADARQFSGQTAKCVRSRKAWDDSMGDGTSVFTIPSRVMVRVPG